jgi:hypothetical protein
MSKCSNPDCQQDHDAQAAISQAVEQVSKAVAKLTQCSPEDVICGIAAALVTIGFSVAKPGAEKEALEDVVDIVREYAQRITESEAIMAQKRHRDAQKAPIGAVANTRPC